MSLELTKKIVKALDDKLARDIEVIKTEEVTIVADYFVIAAGTSNTQVRALADEVEEKMKEIGVYPSHLEGYNGGNWILMDYGDVIIHIFDKETEITVLN